MTETANGVERFIPTSLISDTQFERARELSLPVTITGARTFTCPSATRPELVAHHRVEFDSQEQPHEFSCSCEAAEYGRPCWASARALDVLVSLAVIGAHVGEGVGAAPGGEEAPTFDLRDELVEHAVAFDGPLPSSEAWSGRFEHLTRDDEEALLVPHGLTFKTDKRGRKTVERCGPFQI